MAFTGVATIKKVAEDKFRITGLSLEAGADGTISLSQGAGAVKVTAPEWNRYQTSGAHGGLVELDSSVECDVIVAEAGLAVTKAVSVVKSGNGPTDFLITLANPDAAASGALEIYLSYAGA